MPNRLSATLYCAIVTAGFVLLCGLAVLLPHDPYIRWQSLQGTIFERAKYQYERLHFDPTPVDVILIGSSRTAAAVNPPLLEAELAARGRPLNVLDLSLPASGMDIRLSQAREALRAKPEVDLLVISVVEAFPRDGHQAFGQLGSVSDILTSPWVTNRNLPVSLARLPMRQMKLFAATQMPSSFGYQSAFNERTYPGPSIDLKGGPGIDPALLDSNEHAVALLAESNRRKREITPPLLPPDLAWVEFGLSSSSLEEIVELAHANDTQIAFLFLPFYEGYEEPTERDWLEESGSLWIADWLRKTPRFYNDAAHSSSLAQPTMNAWLADQILRELASPASADER